MHRSEIFPLTSAQGHLRTSPSGLLCQLPPAADMPRIRLMPEKCHFQTHLQRSTYSALMPAARMILPHFSVCSAMKLANSEGALAKGSRADFGKARLERRVSERRIHVTIESRDDVVWRLRRCADAGPTDRFVTCHGVADRRDVRQHGDTEDRKARAIRRASANASRSSSRRFSFSSVARMLIPETRAIAYHGVISAGFRRNRFGIKLEITSPSISNHSRRGTRTDHALISRRPSR